MTFSPVLGALRTTFVGEKEGRAGSCSCMLCRLRPTTLHDKAENKKPTERSINGTSLIKRTWCTLPSSLHVYLWGKYLFQQKKKVAYVSSSSLTVDRNTGGLLVLCFSWHYCCNVSANCYMYKLQQNSCISIDTRVEVTCMAFWPTSPHPPSRGITAQLGDYLWCKK